MTRKNERRWTTIAAILFAVTLPILTVVFHGPLGKIAMAANNPYGIIKGANGTWAIMQCGTGSTSQSCVDHWVIGSGSEDPPAAYGSNGDLFWRTDLKAFRTKTAGVWGDATLVQSGTITADRFVATNGTGSPSVVLYSVTSGAQTGMYRGTNSGVGFAQTGSALFQCWNSGATQPFCQMPFAVDVGASMDLGGLTYSGSKNLTESSATTYASMTSTLFNGGRYKYCVVAMDSGTGRQLRCGSFNWSFVNTGVAGTETCTMSPAAPDQTNDGNAGSLTAGTLTYAFTADTTGIADGCEFKLNATSSLTQTTLAIIWQVEAYQAALVIPK